MCVYLYGLPLALGHVEINGQYTSFKLISHRLAFFSSTSVALTSYPERDITRRRCTGMSSRLGRPVLPVPVMTSPVFPVSAAASLHAVDVLVAVVTDEHVDVVRLPLPSRCIMGSLRSPCDDDGDALLQRRRRLVRRPRLDDTTSSGLRRRLEERRERDLGSGRRSREDWRRASLSHWQNLSNSVVRPARSFVSVDMDTLPCGWSSAPAHDDRPRRQELSPGCGTWSLSAKDVLASSLNAHRSGSFLPWYGHTGSLPSASLACRTLVQCSSPELDHSRQNKYFFGQQMAMRKVCKIL